MFVHLDIFVLAMEAYAHAPRAMLMQRMMTIMLRALILMMTYTLPMVMVVTRLMCHHLLTSCKESPEIVNSSRSIFNFNFNIKYIIIYFLHTCVIVLTILICTFEIRKDG